MSGLQWFRVNKEAQKAIAAIEKRYGYVSPEMVVHEAKKQKSPLHKYFDWDNKTAAESHRLWTARQVIRSVQVVVHHNKTDFKTVAYVRDPSRARNEQGYISVAKIRNNKETARDALMAGFERIQEQLNRLYDLAKAFNMENQIDTIRHRVETARMGMQEKETRARH